MYERRLKIIRRDENNDDDVDNDKHTTAKPYRQWAI